jgi:hypothetical protein
MFPQNLEELIASKAIREIPPPADSIELWTAVVMFGNVQYKVETTMTRLTPIRRAMDRNIIKNIRARRENGSELDIILRVNDEYTLPVDAGLILPLIAAPYCEFKIEPKDKEVVSFNVEFDCILLSAEDYKSFSDNRPIVNNSGFLFSGGHLVPNKLLWSARHSQLEYFNHVIEREEYTETDVAQFLCCSANLPSAFVDKVKLLKKQPILLQ